MSPGIPSDLPCLPGRTANMWSRTWPRGHQTGLPLWPGHGDLLWMCCPYSTAAPASQQLWRLSLEVPRKIWGAVSMCGAPWLELWLPSGLQPVFPQEWRNNSSLELTLWGSGAGIPWVPRAEFGLEGQPSRLLLRAISQACTHCRYRSRDAPSRRREREDPMCQP